MAAKVEMHKGMVTASTRGYAGGEILEPGETFYYEGPLGRWMEPVADAKPAAPAKSEPPAKSAT